MSETTALILRLRQRYSQVARMNPRLKGFRAYANWIRSNYELWTGASQIRARPVKLTFDPTNVCQLRCPLCPTGLQVHDRDAGHAQFHMFEHLLKELGDYLFFIDFFNWGEPLLNTRVEEFIELASAKKIVCTMSTNLSLPLTDDRIGRIVSSGLNEMIVSLDGASSETYETYRRQGKFDLVCENMRRIVEMKRRLGQTFPLVTWQFLVFRFNEHEIEKAKGMAAEIGVDRILFRPPFLDLDRYPLPGSARRAMAEWAPTSPLYQIPNSSAAPEKTSTRCGWHYMSTAINWDGAVSPCCTLFEKRHDFGTIGKNAERLYMEVVNNSSFRAVRDRYSGRQKEPIALVCEHCPTPSIMDYHKFLNRQVVLFSFVGAMKAVSGIFGGSRSRGSRKDGIAVGSPACLKPGSGRVGSTGG